MHEIINANIVPVIGQWSEKEFDYYRYINPNEAIEKLHPSFADECSIISLRFENPARILQKLPSCVMRDKRYEHIIANPNADSGFNSKQKHIPLSASRTHFTWSQNTVNFDTKNAISCATACSIITKKLLPRLPIDLLITVQDACP